MKTLLQVQQQNLDLKQFITASFEKLNSHSQTIATHENRILDNSAQIKDVQHALLDREPTSEIRISGFPNNFDKSPDEIAESVLSFIGCDYQKFEGYILETRIMKTKAQNPANFSVIIEFISDKVCEKVIQKASEKRKNSTFY